MIKKIGLVILILIPISLALAENTGDLLLLKETITQEVNHVVKSFDPNAYTLIKVIPQTKKYQVPSTPFSIPQMALNPKLNSISIEKIEIKVFTKVKKIPELALQQIQEIGQQYEAKIEVAPSQPVERMAASEESLWSHLFSVKNIIMTLTLFTLLGLGLLYLMYKNKSTQLLHSTIQNGLNQISGALENQSTQEAYEALEVESVSSEASPEGEEKLLQHFHADSLVALLSDCYWCEEDSYAAYIWFNTPLDLREKSLKKVSFLKDYCESIISLEQKNLNRHQEPYYMNPLPILQVNNEDLTKLVQAQKNLFHHLPSLRKEKLTLTPSEFIQMSQMDLQPIEANQIFKNVPPSPLRALKQRIRFKIKSVEEEEELLKMTDLSLEIKKDIPSLGWLMDLSEEELSQLLKPYTANDLASLWVGPPHVLERLSQCLPEKKWTLVQSYMENHRPSRYNKTFQNLLRSGLALIQKKEPSEDLNDEKMAS